MQSRVEVEKVLREQKQNCANEISVDPGWTEELRPERTLTRWTKEGQAHSGSSRKELKIEAVVRVECRVARR